MIAIPPDVAKRLRKMHKMESKIGVTFEVKIRAEIKFDSEVNMYVAHVPALRIYSQAETASQAKEAIKDAVESYLEVLHKNTKGLLEK